MTEENETVHQVNACYHNEFCHLSKWANISLLVGILKANSFLLIDQFHFQIESEMKRLLNIISEDQETILQKEKQVWKFFLTSGNQISQRISSKSDLGFKKSLSQLEQKSLQIRSWKFFFFGNTATIESFFGCHYSSYSLLALHQLKQYTWHPVSVHTFKN